VGTSVSAIKKHNKGQGHITKLTEYKKRHIKDQEVAAALEASRLERQTQGLLHLRNQTGPGACTPASEDTATTHPSFARYPSRNLLARSKLGARRIEEFQFH